MQQCAWTAAVEALCISIWVTHCPCWQHLQLQMPQQLARACMVKLSDNASINVLPLALEALDCFQVWAVSNRLLPDTASEPGLPDNARAALANSVTEQLLQAGLPQHLIGLMSAAAQQLAAAPAAPASYRSPIRLTTRALLRLATQLLRLHWLFQLQGTSSPECFLAVGSVASVAAVSVTAAGAAAAVELVL